MMRKVKMRWRKETLPSTWLTNKSKNTKKNRRRWLQERISSIMKWINLSRIKWTQRATILMLIRKLSLTSNTSIQWYKVFGGGPGIDLSTHQSKCKLYEERCLKWKIWKFIRELLCKQWTSSIKSKTLQFKKLLVNVLDFRKSNSPIVCSTIWKMKSRQKGSKVQCSSQNTDSTK